MQPSIHYKCTIYKLFNVLCVAIKTGCRLKNSRELRLNETDVIMLNSIVSGDLIAGEALQKRARAILLLSEGKQIKDTAKEIGMRENSVTEIRVQNKKEKSRRGLLFTRGSHDRICGTHIDG